MKGKLSFGTLLFALGVLLIISALLLSLYNLNEEKQAGEQSLDVVSRMQEQILSDNRQATSDSDIISRSDAAYIEEQVMQIDGEKYIGILAIPSLGLNLPVRDELSDSALKSSPCCYCGSVEEENLVIAAHNYQTHFGTLNLLALGEEVFFTDSSGITTEYYAAEIEILKPYEVMRMTESEYPLTLFTCTVGGRSRVTVRCEKVNN